MISKHSLFAVGLTLALAGAGAATAQDTTAPPGDISGSTVDHSKLEALQKEFTTGPEVTTACLSCHTEAATQVKQSIHWSWDYEHPDTGQDLGKNNVINSYCVGVAANEPRCTSCHVGYGWKDMNEPPPQEASAVDCLVCHDKSDTYFKIPAGAGNPFGTEVKEGAVTNTGKPAKPVDLKLVAQSVGQPDRDNCGNCHFYGGGGDNVKHGDLSSVLHNPTEDIDVHMASDGLNFTCSECHVSDQHQWHGSRYNVTAKATEGAPPPGQRHDVATCESCHDTEPHDSLTLIGFKLNSHRDKIACQTCHIPEYAKGGVPTKTLWDWSTAGKKNDEGKPFKVAKYESKSGKKKPTYVSMKGDFEWGEDLQPEYFWFDGQVEYANADMDIDPTQVVEVNMISGSQEDDKSRIWPFKVMRGKQPYDTERNRLLYPHLFGPGSDTAYWGKWDWDKAFEAGAAASGTEYSGSYDFVSTEMYWPITHMVAPSKDAVQCEECHKENGRLANIAGIHIPGANPMGPGGKLGALILLLTLGGIVIHAIMRFFGRKNMKEQ
ncbi:tetrathionate reductase family octaheme c-type cytochrome [Aliiruegeria sabulilitoris]|uniref:tetrathionate reductase family octaheme c-type cytochrome n=1 Tax=Aliiruegeria sabulilitoris TaxID=1510458 RepID=UPI00082DC894|nr:tetrathionate reductase family octaheme c-type cytochrome [Aliiruegeria sabulilitoris]NDR55025.1 tetrathionate reductase family octaheme c-type cytochrome [Pseudoruegeria sp. M32A2M]